MKNKFKNCNGMTLMSIGLTIIVLLIVVSITTRGGIDAIKHSEFIKFETELKIMQTQVNELYDKWKNEGDDSVLNKGESIASNNKAKSALNALGITNTSDYRYYKHSTINGLGIDGVEREYIVNIKTRSVVSYEGVSYQGKIYYSLDRMSNGLYNVK